MILFTRSGRIATLVASGLLTAVLLVACEQGHSEHTFAFETMGTQASCQLLLPSGLTAMEAEGMVRDSFSLVNSNLSTWSRDSEISILNRAPADSNVTMSPQLQTCLQLSQELQKNSGGAFDPTAESLMRLWGFYRRQGVLPSTAELDSAMADLGQWHMVTGTEAIVKEKSGTRFDLGGIAKGLAVDMAAARLRQAGVHHGLIDLGGNLYCLGGAPGRENWRVGIRNPNNRDELFATVSISDESVATSGSYERFVMIDGRRFGHIMNPATGQPAEGMLSVTVIAPEGILADGLSTTLFVLGPEKALPFLRQYYPGVEAILVIPATTGEMDFVVVTPGLKNRLSLIPGFEEQYLVVVVGR
jgi:FAD:protein FMN transferase